MEKNYVIYFNSLDENKKEFRVEVDESMKKFIEEQVTNCHIDPEGNDYCAFTTLKGAFIIIPYTMLKNFIVTFQETK